MKYSIIIILVILTGIISARMIRTEEGNNNNDKAREKDQKKTGVRFVFFEKNMELPDIHECIIVSPNGDLRTIMAHPINDDLLKRIFQKKFDKTKYFLIKFGNEKDTSVEILSKLLCKIKDIADPNEDIVVYVYLKQFANKKKE